jgi:acyl-coenzyme A thioesterase PaaI-like protein
MSDAPKPRFPDAPRFFYSEPEALFRVGPLLGEDDRADGKMLTGEWLRNAAGRPSRGSMFVLIDDVFGVAAMGHRPAERWAVTTEISVDFLSDPPSDGRTLSANAAELADDANGSLSRGSVFDPRGALLATGTLRVRYTDALPKQLQDESHLMLPHFERESPGATGTVEDLLGARFEDDHRMVLAPSTLLSNSMGPLHGGILGCASELLGITVARHTDPGFVTTSVRVAFVRPGPSETAVAFTAVKKHAGRTLQVIEVTSWNPAGKPCSIATVLAQVEETS